MVDTTPTAPRDVNAELRAQRADGPGWDKFEYEGRDGLAVNAQGAMLALDGGKDKQPAWHRLGHVRSGPMTVEDALTLPGLAWGVIRQPAVNTNPLTGEVELAEGEFDLFRDDTGRYLTRVGRQYTPVPNREQFQFLERVSGVAEYRSSGMLANGRVFVSLEVPEALTTSINGADEYVRLYLVGINSFNRTTPFGLYITPWRPVCGNTERWARTQALLKWTRRHSSGVTNDVDDARAALQLLDAFRTDWTETTHQLAKHDILLREFDALAAEVTGMTIDPASPELTGPRARDNAVGRQQVLHNLLQVESERLGGQTRLAAQHALTNWLDNVKPVRTPKTFAEELVRADQALGGTHDAVKQRAAELLLTTTGRIEQRRR